MRPTILCIEGKYSGVPIFNAALEKKGYLVRRARTGKDAIDNLKENKSHVVVINAPSMRTTGIRICKSIRSRKRGIPIILIATEEDALSGYDIDANLVLQLPFTIRKLNNRIRQMLPATNEDILRTGPIYLDTDRLLVKCQDKEAQLTPKTAELLEMLMLHPGEVLKREALFSKVWETDFTDDTRTLDVHISWLRRAIEENPRKPQFIKTLRGIGYRLDT